MDGLDASSYGDAFADVYDDWYPSSAQTTVAVDALAGLAGRGPVLELGCGTGRLCLPLLGRGLEVVGLDASPAMLARLRAKPEAGGLEAHRGDMARFELGTGRFGLVFAAFNTLFNLGSASEQQACFATVARHLRPGGRFVVECFVPAGRDSPPESGSGSPPDSGSSPEPGQVAGVPTPAGALPLTDAIELRALSADRVVLRVSRQDHAAQTVSGQHVELSGAGVRLRPWHLRYASPDELDDLAGRAGLRVERRWSDWAEAPFDEQADQHVTVYRRPDPGGALPAPPAQP